MSLQFYCVYWISGKIISMSTLGGEGGVGDGGAWPTELWPGLDPLWLLLFWSSGLSDAGEGLGCVDRDTLLAASAAAAVSLDASMATEGGDKRRASKFRF